MYRSMPKIAGNNGHVPIRAVVCLRLLQNMARCLCVPERACREGGRIGKVLPLSTWLSFGQGLIRTLGAQRLRVSARASAPHDFKDIMIQCCHGLSAIAYSSNSNHLPEPIV